MFPPAEVSSRIDALQTKILPLRIEDSIPRGRELGLPVRGRSTRALPGAEQSNYKESRGEFLERSSLPSLLQPDRSGMLKAVASPDALRIRVDTELEVFRKGDCL